MRAEIAEHEAALVAGPPDLSLYQKRISGRVDRLEHDAQVCWDQVGSIDRQLQRTGGVHRLRPENRREHRRLLERRVEKTAELDTIRENARAARRETDRAATEVAERRRWEAANQWRHHEIGRLDHQLALHWTRTIVEVVHQGDPLAYGLDRLRAVRTFLAGDHGGADRRDLTAVGAALARARTDRLAALGAGAQPPVHLAELLGPVPDHQAARDTWLGLAAIAEAPLDAGAPVQSTTGNDVLDRLDRLSSRNPIDHAQSLLAAAHHLPYPTGADGPDRWQATVEHADTARRTLERQRTRELDHGIGLSL